MYIQRIMMIWLIACFFCSWKEEAWKKSGFNGIHSSVGRASHRYRGAHRFEFRWSPDFFFRLLLSSCLSWKFTVMIILLFYVHPQYKIWNISSTHQSRLGWLICFLRLSQTMVYPIIDFSFSIVSKGKCSIIIFMWMIDLVLILESTMIHQHWLFNFLPFFSSGEKKKTKTKN